MTSFLEPMLNYVIMDWIYAGAKLLVCYQDWKRKAIDIGAMHPTHPVFMPLKQPEHCPLLCLNPAPTPNLNTMQVNHIATCSNCYNCQQPRHIAWNCPWPQVQPRIPQTDVHANDTSTVTIDELEALVVELWDTVDVTKKELEMLKAMKADFPTGEE